MIRHAAENTDFEGLMINPYRETSHGAILYLNRDNLNRIIQNAEEIIDGLPESIRDAVRKGI